MRARYAAILGGFAILLVVAVAVATRPSVLAALLPRVVSLATGYDVTFSQARFQSGHLALLHVHAARHGEPVLDASRIDVDYSLRDLLPGSTHRYGITSVEIAHPTLTLVKHKDGSFNVALPQPGQAGPVAPSPPNRVPFRLTVRIRDGVGSVRAPYALDAQSRVLGVRDINLDATIDTLARTHYIAGGVFVSSPAHMASHFRAVGTIDEQRGFAMHRVTAGALPIRPVLNFFINSNAALFLGGVADRFDVRAYALDVRPYATIDYHLGGSVNVAGASLQIVGFAAPLHNISGRVQLVDNVMFFNRLDATLVHTPLVASGGIFNFADPHYQIGLRGFGSLDDLREMFTFSSHRDVRGIADVRAQIAGPLGSPLVTAHLDARQTLLQGLPLHDVHATIAYSNATLYVAPMIAQTHDSTVEARGLLRFGAHVQSELAVHARAAAGVIPYANEILNGETLLADGVVDGTDTTFDAYGAIASTRGVNVASAVVDATRDGRVSFDPVWIDTPRAHVAGAYDLDRKNDASAFWLLAHDTRLTVPSRVNLLGNTIAMPAIDATVDRAALEGSGPSGTRALVAGYLQARDARVAGFPLTTLSARFAGTLADAAVDPARATGPWGRFDGSGALGLSGIAVRGRYRGTLDGLQPYLAGIPAHGAVEGTAAVAIAANRITVQGDNLRFAGASVRGLPLNAATGTLAVRDGVVHVLNASAQIAGGTLVAAGSYDRGIALVAHGLDGARLRSLGVPLDGGEVNAVGTIRQGGPLPRFDGGVAVANGRAQQFAVAGSGLVALGGDGVRLDHVVGALDGNYAIAGGSIGALTSGAPSYDIRAEIPAVSVANVVRTFRLPVPPSDGVADGTVTIGGSGLDPTIRGPVGIPGGSVNGLPFTDATAMLAASTTGATARRGNVLVGSTAVRFAAGVHPHISGVHVRADRASLEDFDNYFDTGDTLGGHGSVKFSLIAQASRLSTNGDVNVRDLRYRNLPIGDTVATWSSLHNTVRGAVDIGGDTGVLRAHGVVEVAPSLQVQQTLLHSDYNVALHVGNLDLSTWLAALGFAQLPVSGRLNADASVAGAYPRLRVVGNASMEHATLGPLPVDRFDAQVGARGNALQLTSATLVAPGLTATANGQAGLAATDPLALHVYLNSDDVPLLVSEISGTQVPIQGLFEATVSVGGTFAHPTFVAAFDADNATLYGVTVTSLFGSLRLDGQKLELRNAGIEFAQGQATIAGSLPLQLEPFAIGPSRAPVNLDLAVNGVDPSVFDAVFGHHTLMDGSIDGQLGIGGTVGAPRIAGDFGVTQGSYVSDFDRTKITGITGSLNFTSTQAEVRSLQAKLGNGTLAASGAIHFPQGFSSSALGGGGATFDLRAKAKGAQIDSPTFGSGTIDGTLALTRASGHEALLRSDVALTNTAIPFSAFLAAAGNASGGSSGPPLALGFDVNLTAGKNVRVRGSGFGAGLDIGATGAARLTGDLANPKMDGVFTSTGGTLTYFDRAFRVTSGSVTFDPADGVIPTLDATGTTHVNNADASHGGFGSADITLNVSGQINQLKLAFSSNPPGYTNEQILAMIAPFGSLVVGNSTIAGSTTATGINGVPVYGALAPIPGAQQYATGAQAQGFSVGEEAFNILNAQFAAGLLSPVENALSNGLGFQSINLTVDYYGNVGFQATKFLGKTLNFVYASTFGYSAQQSFALQLVGKNYTSAQLAFYFNTGAQRLFETPNSTTSSSRLSVGQPLQGQSGFAFTLQRLYW